MLNFFIEDVAFPCVYVRRPSSRRKNNRFELKFYKCIDQTKWERETNVIDNYTSVGNLKIYLT